MYTIPTYDRPVYVYRVYGAEGVLLYVGISTDFQIRRGQHKRKAHWFVDAVSWEVVGPFKRTFAVALEAEAIAKEHPLYNGRARGI